MHDKITNLISEGIACIPVKSTKAPALEKGSKYFDEIIPDDQIDHFFKNAWGFGVKCGSISEGLEAIDFDHDKESGETVQKVYEAFVEHDFVKHLISEGLIYRQKTQSGGYHIVYRYESENFDGNKKLAKWQSGDTMIETRGESGYIVGAPSPGYQQVNGVDLEEIARLEKEERDLLHEIAKSFSLQKVSASAGESEQLDYYAIEDTDPITRFNFEKIAYAKKLLEDKGWVKVDKTDGIEKWRRPGKDSGISATWGYKHNALYVFSTNVKDFKQNCYYTPFQILIKLRFKGKYQDALKWLTERNVSKEDAPYIRVGVDYFKKITKLDRYGVRRNELKPWKKDEIKLDHGKEMLQVLPRYDDFVIAPDNKGYRSVIDNCYNLYRPFNFEAAEGKWKWTEILLRHIFKDKFEIGLKYLQIMYLMPWQQLPILALVSKQRKTGKTTFINWLAMLFGDNMTIISPEDLNSSFNFMYATKNVICVDETSLEKQKAVEKLKALNTAKQITVNAKYTNQYHLPFYAKIILASNFEDRFVRIDDEEIRYFVRKLDEPKINNVNIEEDLIKEIPAFLAYLESMPEPEIKTRMAFTAEEIDTPELKKVKTESKPVLYKELMEYFTEFFNDNRKKEIYATPTEIKERWFKMSHNITASYIRRVLKEDFNMLSENRMTYYAFADMAAGKKGGTPFKFERKIFIPEDIIEMNEIDSGEDDLPF